MATVSSSVLGKTIFEESESLESTLRAVVFVFDDAVVNAGVSPARDVGLAVTTSSVVVSILS